MNYWVSGGQKETEQNWYPCESCTAKTTANQEEHKVESFDILQNMDPVTAGVK